MRPSPTRERYMRYCNIEGVFHRQGWGRVSRNLQRGDGGFRLSRGRREGRISGWAGTLSPRDSGGVPRVLLPPLGDRDGDGPVGSAYSTCVHVRSRGWCHIWGAPPHSVLETLRLRSGRTEFPSPGDGFRLSAAGMTWEKGVEGSRLGGGCAFRRDGFLPPQE